MKNYYLYFIRHGITEGNLEGKYIGVTDLSLCKEGEDTIKAYKDMELYPRVQKVYTSPLKRCIETANIIYPDNMQMLVDEIMEMDFGSFEGCTQAELADNADYAEWLKGGFEACPPDGESYKDFTLRCINGLDMIFEDMRKKEITRAAVITHGGVITNLLSGYGLPKGKPADYLCGPGEGFEILLSTFMWQHGPAFEVGGRLFVLE